MPKVVKHAVEKIAISLPAELLGDVERLRRATGESRSAVIRRSLELMLGRIETDAMVREYVEGYLRHPETREETDAARATATQALEDVPWE